jgi:acyl carrier protein
LQARESQLLAISCTFGASFLEEADPGLIAALQDSPERWGQLLIASWRAAQVGARTSPDSATTRIPDPQPARTAPPAPTFANGHTPEPSPLSIFDPEHDPPATSTSPRDYSREEVRKYLVDVIVEKTGYPPETFDEPLDFEADLGIDSIKQVEAMSEVRQHFELSLDENFRMRDYPTVDAAADYIVLRLQGVTPDPPTSPPRGAEAGEPQIVA